VEWKIERWNAPLQCLLVLNGEESETKKAFKASLTETVILMALDLRYIYKVLF
jgi:hypothetical protein